MKYIYILLIALMAPVAHIQSMDLKSTGSSRSESPEELHYGYTLSNFESSTQRPALGVSASIAIIKPRDKWRPDLEGQESSDTESHARSEPEGNYLSGSSELLNLAYPTFYTPDEIPQPNQPQMLGQLNTSLGISWQS